MKNNSLEDLGESTNQESSESLNDILSPYLYRWPVFLIGIIISFSTAMVYLRYAIPNYQISSLLLIKDDKDAGANNDILKQLDLFTVSKEVENEIEIIKSKTLIQEVVNRLNLDISQKNVGKIISREVYYTRPVIISTNDINESFYGKPYFLSFPDNKNFLLEDQETQEIIKGEIGEIQKNKIGVFKVTPTKYFKKELNKSLEIIFLNPNHVITEIGSKLKIESSSNNSSVLKITFTSTVPDKGKDIINTLVKVYNEESLKDKNQTVKNSIDFINERLKLIVVELNDVEGNVENFKSTQGLTDITGEASLFLENVKTTDAQLNEVNLKLGVIRNIRNTLKQDFIEKKLPSTLGIEDAVLVAQISQLYTLELQKTNLLATLSPTNPVFTPIDDQIKNLKFNISSSLNGLEKSLENIRNSLTKYNNRYENSIKKLPGQEREFISIKRQQSIKENLYLYLLQKREEAILSFASAAADTRVIESANVLPTPISPKKDVVFLGALIGGLLLAFAYVYLLEILNDRIRSAKDVKKFCNINILGEIIQQESSELIVENSRSAMAEQLRSLRTNLQYVKFRNTTDKKGSITLLTSNMSGEGKSFVACNLAAVYALSEKKTILLELDLRKPKVSQYLGLKNKEGFSNYFIGQANISDIIQPLAGFNNFSVISSGPIPPNPAELLIEERLDKLFNYLRANYDEIIIDSPPVGLVIDAQILSTYADATLFIVRQDVTFKKQLVNMKERELKFPKLNIVLNGVKSYRGYGYGYGYGYYGSEKNNKWKFSFRNLKKRLA